MQGLAQVDDLARAIIQHDGLLQEVPLQVLADVIHLGPQQLEQLQAIVAGCEQLVEFTKGLVQQAGGFADVGLGQVGDPAFEVLWRSIAE
ncbi:hypothetical protein D9M68_846080 [compost metagenome]